MKSYSLFRRSSMFFVPLAFFLLAQPVFGQEPFWTEARKSDRSKTTVPDLTSFAPLAEQAMPAVVTVYTMRRIQVIRLFGSGESLVPEGGGSGFILSPDGYIITNHHVVARADTIKVVVGGKQKKEYEARLIGVDPDIDLALIKIEGEDLPVLPLGDSDRLRVGDWVAAIGSPFNFPHTFTVGVVSAKGRRLGIGNYDDFIQTDASINTGNSGGPLINIYGEVVGINTLIVSPTGGFVGIGFAVPINLVKSVLLQLHETGKVTRSWLGVTIEPVSEELAQELGLPRPIGARVVQVVIDGPADKAGITVGDVIIEFNGRTVENSHELPAWVSSLGVGQPAALTWIHEGERITRTVTLEALPGREELAKFRVRGGVEVDNILGVGVRDITEEDVRERGLANTQGVLVVSVVPASVAEKHRIQEGDVIYKINLANIRDVADFDRVVRGLRPGKMVRISIKRGPASIIRVFRME